MSYAISHSKVLFYFQVPYPMFYAIYTRSIPQNSHIFIVYTIQKLVWDDCVCVCVMALADGFWNANNWLASDDCKLATTFHFIYLEN